MIETGLVKIYQGKDMTGGESSRSTHEYLYRHELLN